MMKIQIFLVIFLLLSLSPTLNGFEDFSIQVAGQNSQCIGEFFSDFTFINLTIDGDAHDDIFVFRIYYEKKLEEEGESEKELIYNATNLQIDTGIAQTSMAPYKAEIKKTGEYLFCIQNLSPQERQFYFKITIEGRSAEFKKHKKIHEGEKIDHKIQKLQKQLASIGQVIHLIGRDSDIVFKNEEIQNTQADDVSYKILMFSFTTMVACALLTIIELFFLRKFFVYKKLI